MVRRGGRGREGGAGSMVVKYENHFSLLGARRRRKRKRWQRASRAEGSWANTNN